MLTQMEYDALRPFRDGPVHTPDGPTEMMLHLKSKGYIDVSETDVRPGLTIVHTKWVITVPGRAALESHEDRQEYHRKQARQQRSDDKQQACDPDFHKFPPGIFCLIVVFQARAAGL